MADIGAIFNQKECPLVHWIYGKLYANNKGPDSRDETVLSLLSPLSRQTDGL